MSQVEFKIDFRNAVPQGHLPTFKQATSSYIQTVPNAPQGIGFRQHRQRGVFIITVDPKDANRLENQKLTYNYGPNNYTGFGTTLRL